VRAVGWLGALLLRALGATWRVRTSGVDPFARGGPFVPVLWHRGFLVAVALFRGRGIAVPVSRSRDGDLVDAVLQRLGYAPSPRGSSSRGATALLREMIRRARAGVVVAVLPDGPRGPARVAKPGAVALAAAAGAPLVPVALEASPAWRFGSWDAALLPLPFARVHCRYGAPLLVPKRPGPEEIEAMRREMEGALDRLGAELARDAGAAGGAPGPARGESGAGEARRAGAGPGRE
jgi:lysophospholipid acyltransferase (LPLAT)-like uncharacterized protein